MTDKEPNKSGDFSGASWIGVSESFDCKEIQSTLFRYTFYLDSECSLDLKISASTRYRLWINGMHVVAGPCKGDRWRWFYDTIDAGRYLLRGKNVIAVKVVAFRPAEARENEHEEYVGGPLSLMVNAIGTHLLVKGICRDGRENHIVNVSTGVADWRVYPDTSTTWKLFPETMWMGPMEDVDGNMVPTGWHDQPDLEKTWNKAVITHSLEESPVGLIERFPLKRRPIPFLYEEKKAFVREMPLRKGGEYQALSFLENRGKNRNEKVRLPSYSAMCIELDAGELTTGYFHLPVEGGKGSCITITYAECYSLENPGKLFTIKGVRDDTEHYHLLGHHDIYRPSGEAETYEPFWFRTFRFIRIEVQTGGEALTLYRPSYTETGYPLNVETHLQSKDNTVNSWIPAVWEMSLRTLQRCMHETYEDCPYYEQLQYAMDTRLEILFTYAVSNDTKLALRAIEDFHYSLLPEGLLQSRFPSIQPQVIPVFSFYWILMIDDYYQHTADASVPRRYRSTIDMILEWYDRKIGKDGLVGDTGFWRFVDWVKEWEHLEGVPPAVEQGPLTVINLQYAYVLRIASRLVSVTGRTGMAEEYLQRSNDIIQTVENKCWSAAPGLYRDGPNCEQYSQHAQVWAVLSGCATGEKAKRIMETAMDEAGLVQCSFVMQFYVFRALETAGIYELTEPLWEKWKELLKLNLTTIIESVALPRSDCHGWGALPLYEFTRKFLGVNPSAPGWEGILIEPKAWYIGKIEGTAVTPKGPVQISWEYDGHNCIIAGNSPFDVPLTVSLPGGIERKFSRGGRFKFKGTI